METCRTDIELLGESDQYMPLQACKWKTQGFRILCALFVAIDAFRG